MRAYDTFFDRVLTRTDAETAHQQAFRAIRGARPATALLGARVRRRATPVEAMGLTFPVSWDSPPGSTRTPRGSTPSPHSGSRSSRSAP